MLLVGVSAAVVGAMVLGEMYGGPPSVRDAPAPVQAPRRLPPAQAFDTAIAVDVPSGARPGTGTAFSVSSGGVWLTARHVVEGCARAAIIVGAGQGVAAEVRIDPRGETAVLITQGGAPSLPMAPRENVRRGMIAFHAGFPHGRPGEVASRLLRRQTLVLRGRRTRREQVLTWEETSDIDPSRRNLAGLSGAPTLDGAGQVIGVTIAQSRHHGWIYTTTPGALRAALARAHIEPATGAKAAPMTTDSYARIATRLRRDLRIVPVVCLSS
jgi:serine protease Do